MLDWAMSAGVTIAPPAIHKNSRGHHVGKPAHPPERQKEAARRATKTEARIFMAALPLNQFVLM
jgi:hypothetical protein